jgi:hypothetical protein
MDASGSALLTVPFERPNQMVTRKLAAVAASPVKSARRVSTTGGTSDIDRTPMRTDA